MGSPKTNPETGETCALLNKTERKQLARSKSTLRLYAALNVGKPLGKIAGEAGANIGEL
ncbi:hypothetical protein LCGC14_1156010 [marine sediment metagenome]|uniref:Uncharacterized protein n=1 Tax=marine sediment metagenome TaxID=412755 RepID=A0A0F9LYW8_9ZZZZ